MEVRIREAGVGDVAALAALHVRTWREAYRGVLSEKDLNGPTFEIRDRQWRELFARNDGSWQCWVVEGPSGELVGFAQVRLSDHPEFGGELSKIYLLAEYQRMGLGHRLFGLAVRWLLERGIESMWVFADGRNPSCGFYRALGGVKLDEDPMLGNYGWRDLRRLAEI